ncbi:hypothetical protein ACH4KW_05440 [Streptomyces lydicus]|uniref:hypothetical protein n=1 Tax=Streptomyces lydicus TaxID=47763 RepID=UPI00378CB6D6
MSSPQGGGLTPERQAFRERIRLEAAERFAAGFRNVEVDGDAGRPPGSTSSA